MNPRLSGIALVASIACGSHAWAVDAHQSTLNQRQVRGCMIKRMTADRTLSYNDAKKTCADELKSQSNTLSPPLAAAGRPGG